MPNKNVCVEKVLKILWIMWLLMQSSTGLVRSIGSTHNWGKAGIWIYCIGLRELQAPLPHTRLTRVSLRMDLMFGPHSPIKDAGYLDSLSLAYDKREETHQTGKMELSGFLSAINFSKNIFCQQYILGNVLFFASNPFCKSNLPEHVLREGWHLQKWWIFGKVPKGGGGSFPIQKFMLQILDLK